MRNSSTYMKYISVNCLVMHFIRLIILDYSLKCLNGKSCDVSSPWALELNRPSDFRWAAGRPNSVKFVVCQLANNDF